MMAGVFFMTKHAAVSKGYSASTITLKALIAHIRHLIAGIFLHPFADSHNQSLL
jgi:hypothetical protein